MISSVLHTKLNIKKVLTNEKIYGYIKYIYRDSYITATIYHTINITIIWNERYR